MGETGGSKREMRRERELSQSLKREDGDSWIM